MQEANAGRFIVRQTTAKKRAREQGGFDFAAPKDIIFFSFFSHYSYGRYKI